MVGLTASSSRWPGRRWRPAHRWSYRSWPGLRPWYEAVHEILHVDSPHAGARAGLAVANVDAGGHHCCSPLSCQLRLPPHARYVTAAGHLGRHVDPRSSCLSCGPSAPTLMISAMSLQKQIAPAGQPGRSHIQPFETTATTSEEPRSWQRLRTDHLDRGKDPTECTPPAPMRSSVLSALSA